MKLSRIAYLFYYIKKLDKDKFNLFVNYAKTKTGKMKILLIFDAITCVFTYNISILEYFQFRFFSKNRNERKKWAGTGFLYEYQLKMNPKRSRMILEDKIKFLNHFNPFIIRRYADLQTLKSNYGLLQNLLTNNTGKLVLKGSLGQVGAEVEVISCTKYSLRTLIDYMTQKKYNLLEEYVEQHPALMALSPSGLNTVRVFTQLHEEHVDILGARLRVSVNSTIDNMAAGNLAAPINIETGVVNGPGVYSDITKEDRTTHPITGKIIDGFIVPLWDKAIELAQRAALHTPENRSVGWDIAITEQGPELIEGNHNWCKLLWQLPVKQGLKSELEKYL